MTYRIVAGIDPGQKWTAFVARRGPEVIAASVYAREEETMPPYCAEVARQVLAHCRKLPGEPLIGIENVVAPTSHKGMIKVEPIIETARMAGWLQGVLSQEGFATVLVEPDEFGTSLLSTYPQRLIGARETTGGGKGVMQHARAAYDISHAAPAYDVGPQV